jgi:5'-phosphate synthase pdxT subunit
MNVGVLGLQGAIREHVRSLKRLGVDARIVKRPRDLEGLAGLILPGGESSTMTLLGEDGILERLRAMAAEGFPLFGTCAGMILLAREAEGRQRPGLDAIDITVARNASGRQVDSFETSLDIEGIGPDVPAVFIRAPYVTRVGAGVTPMARHDGFVVMARQGRVLAASFHPELTDDLRVHRYFIEEMVQKEDDG